MMSQKIVSMKYEMESEIHSLKRRLSRAEGNH
jgi:hypothetical protein